MTSPFRLDESLSVVELQTAGSTPAAFSPQDMAGDGVALLFGSNKKFYLSAFDTSENYYIDTLNNQLWRPLSAQLLLEKINERNINLLIYYEKYNLLKDYGSISSVISVVSPENNIFYVVNYSDEEEGKLSSLYDPAPPEIAFSINENVLGSNSFQNTIQASTISYSSLSSLGSITQESFTITSTTGSADQLLTEETQNISDVGGLSGGGRDREITSTGISSTIATEAGLGVGVTSTTVTTSGY